ncbi:MAG: DUF5684 domain-containing protein [Lachnospiraceae bacterium]|nr:DUF5684 domain-containing protein [Lachnospiraceae bacterium]
MNTTGLFIVSGGMKYMYFFPFVLQLFVAVIGLWKMFAKAGEKGWKALVPGLNLYVIFKIAGENRLFVKTVTDAVIMTVALIAGEVAERFMGKSNVASLIDMIAGIAFFIFLLMIVIRLIMVTAKLAASFRLGVIWFICMVLFPGIAYIVIGFSKNIRYIGPDAGPDDFDNDEPDGPRFTNPYTSYRDF